MEIKLGFRLLKHKPNVKMGWGMGALGHVKTTKTTSKRLYETGLILTNILSVTELRGKGFSSVVYLFRVCMLLHRNRVYLVRTLNAYLQEFKQ